MSYDVAKVQHIPLTIVTLKEGIMSLLFDSTQKIAII